MDEMLEQLKDAKERLLAAKEEAKQAMGREEAAEAQEKLDQAALLDSARLLGQAEARANLSQQACPPLLRAG